jgi:ABC-2 type transport system permease protein
VLSVFSEGLEKQLGNSAKIELGTVPEISATSTDINPYLSIFSVFDAALIVKIVVSVLVLLVAHDVISGEREQGTLKLMLSNTASRPGVLLGKLLAGLITLLVPITVAFIVGVIILLSFPMMDLSTSDWWRIGLMYIVSLIFISAMYNIGLLFSCLSRNSAISLLLGLFFWIVFVVVIPNGSIYLATQINPLESEEKKDSQVTSLREEFHELQHNMSGARSDSKGAFGKSYVRGCNKLYFESSQKRYALDELARIKYADKVWEVERGYLRSLSKQKYLANNFSRTSPICLYENAMSALAGTDLASFKHFMDEVKTYRNKAIEYIRSKTNNFSSPSYFTTCSKEDALEYEKGWEQWDEKREAMKIVDPALNLQDFPLFIYQPNILKNLQRAVPDMTLLIFINVLFFTLSFVAFIKYDVR